MGKAGEEAGVGGQGDRSDRHRLLEDHAAGGQLGQHRSFDVGGAIGSQPVGAGGVEGHDQQRELIDLVRNRRPVRLGCGVGLSEAAGEEAAQPAAPSIILSDADGVSVLQAGGAAPQVLSAIALDSISYDTAGDVTLAGRGTDTDGFVRVYLNNAPVKTLKIEEDGRWRAPLPDVDTGVYTLRIDEVTADGEVVSRVETPFKREEEEVLASLNDTNGGTNGAQVSVVTVQPGNTLWGISRENYGEGLMYVHVFEANKDRIRNPDLIYPGQVFTVPELAAQE